jgi:hypothetical protein
VLCLIALNPPSLLDCQHYAERCGMMGNQKELGLHGPPYLLLFKGEQSLLAAAVGCCIPIHDPFHKSLALSCNGWLANVRSKCEESIILHCLGTCTWGLVESQPHYIAVVVFLGENCSNRALHQSTEGPKPRVVCMHS